jgi:hypothetical protein
MTIGNTTAIFFRELVCGPAFHGESIPQATKISLIVGTVALAVTAVGITISVFTLIPGIIIALIGGAALAFSVTFIVRNRAVNVDQQVVSAEEIAENEVAETPPDIQSKDEQEPAKFHRIEFPKIDYDRKEIENATFGFYGEGYISVCKKPKCFKILRENNPTLERLKIKNLSFVAPYVNIKFSLKELEMCEEFVRLLDQMVKPERITFTPGAHAAGVTKETIACMAEYEWERPIELIFGDGCGDFFSTEEICKLATMTNLTLRLSSEAYERFLELPAEQQEEVRNKISRNGGELVLPDLPTTAD